MGCFEGKEPDIGSGLSFSLSHEEREATLRVAKPSKKEATHRHAQYRLFHTLGVLMIAMGSYDPFIPNILFLS